jgi:DNA replication protein DnaC
MRLQPEHAQSGGIVIELAKLKFVDAREDSLLIGKPGSGKRHVAKALTLIAVIRG